MCCLLHSCVPNETVIRGLAVRAVIAFRLCPLPQRAAQEPISSHITGWTTRLIVDPLNRKSYRFFRVACLDMSPVFLHTGFRGGSAKVVVSCTGLITCRWGHLSIWITYIIYMPFSLSPDHYNDMASSYKIYWTACKIIWPESIWVRCYTIY